VTATSLDLDLTTLDVHGAPTLDLTPDPPLRARTNTLGYESCDRRPLRSPVPDPDNCSPDELLDYAANCRMHRDMRYDMTDDLKLALISLIERQAIKLDARDDEIVALTRQLAVLQGTSGTLEAAFQRSDKALAATTVELYEERILRVAALQDLEHMRQVAIRRGQERDEIMTAVKP
jgi:hypothetical protein